MCINWAKHPSINWVLTIVCLVTEMYGCMSQNWAHPIVKKQQHVYPGYSALPGGVSLLKCKIRQSFVNRFKAHQKSTTHLNRLNISWHVWHNQNGIVTKNRYEMKPTSMRVSLDRDAPNHPSHETVSVVNPWWLGVPPFRRPTNIEILPFNHWQTDGFGVLSRKPSYQTKNNSEPYRLRMIKGCCHQDNKNELTGNKACYFEWSPPWHLFVIVSDISSGNI